VLVVCPPPVRCTQLRDGKWWPAPVNHRVAVRTYRSQILDRIDPVILAYFRQRLQMVYMDEALAYIPISMAEVDVTHFASRSEVLDTSLASSCVPLISINNHRLHRTFDMGSSVETSSG
jgi:hypothetical protein